MTRAWMLCLFSLLLFVPSIGIAADAPSSSQTKLERTRDILQKKVRAEEGESNESVESSTSQWPKMVQGLMLCLGLFSVFVYFVKRNKKLSGGTAQARMIVLQRLSLSPRASLALVKIDSTEVLIGMCGDQLTPIPVGPFHQEDSFAEPFTLASVQESTCVND